MIDAHVHGIAVEGARNAVAGGTKRVVESEIDKAMTGGGDGRVVEIAADKFDLVAMFFDKARQRVDHFGTSGGGEGDFVVKSTFPRTGIGIFAGFRPLTELSALIIGQRVGTKVAIHHDPRFFVGHFQPKGHNNIAA